jgi:hypothetical protein
MLGTNAIPTATAKSAHKHTVWRMEVPEGYNVRLTSSVTTQSLTKDYSSRMIPWSS